MAKLDETKKLMGALVRMKPKPHEDMKVGKKAKKSNRRRSPASEPGFSLLEKPMLIVQRELERIQNTLTSAEPPKCYSELYAAQQPLVWVLDPDTFKDAP